MIGPPAAVDALLAREQRDYSARRPRSAALATAARRHWPGGVPLHWMKDWPMPHLPVVSRAKGARITPDLSPANTIMGVKQPLNGSLLPDKTYLFFSHVIKGQPQNMALLDEVLSKRCRLVDYECIREGGISTAPRLVAFGTFAGKSGIVNGLRGLGLRLLDLGHSSPFLHVGAAHSYDANCASLHASECICVHLNASACI